MRLKEEKKDGNEENKQIAIRSKQRKVQKRKLIKSRNITV